MHQPGVTVYLYTCLPLYGCPSLILPLLRSDQFHGWYTFNYPFHIFCCEVSLPMISCSKMSDKATLFHGTSLPWILRVRFLRLGPSGGDQLVFSLSKFPRGGLCFQATFPMVFFFCWPHYVVGLDFSFSGNYIVPLLVLVTSFWFKLGVLQVVSFPLVISSVLVWSTRLIFCGLSFVVCQFWHCSSSHSCLQMFPNLFWVCHWLLPTPQLDSFWNLIRLFLNSFVP